MKQTNTTGMPNNILRTALLQTNNTPSKTELGCAKTAWLREQKNRVNRKTEKTKSGQAFLRKPGKQCALQM